MNTSVVSYRVTDECVVMFVDEDQQQTLTQDLNTVCDSSTLQQLLEPLMRQQHDIADKLATLTSNIRALEQQIPASLTGGLRSPNFSERDVAILLIAMFLQIFFVWLLK